MERSYGWRRDRLDHRDHWRHRVLPERLPPSADLRPQCPPVYDQGELGSCTANALAFAFDFGRAKQGLPWLTPSRLFIYYNERELEGTISEDAGAELRDGAKVIAKLGACPESEWPYDVDQFRQRPSDACYATGLLNQSLRYERVVQLGDYLRNELASGFPIAFGFSVYSSFESTAVARTGMVPLPGPDEAPLGGHAVALVGYDDVTRHFIVRNSWGQGWGVAGYFFMPYEYVLNQGLASDFWAIELVENGE